MSQELRQNYTQAATALTKLFNTANQQYKEAYHNGQRAMINEIVQFCIAENNNLKSIELSKLDTFLQNKITLLQQQAAAINSRQTSIQQPNHVQGQDGYYASQHQSNQLPQPGLQQQLPFQQQEAQQQQQQQQHQILQPNQDLTSDQFMQNESEISNRRIFNITGTKKKSEY